MGYTYVYNLKSLMEKSLCRIVFVNDSEKAMDLKSFFSEKNPKYITEINKKFLPHRKIGPFNKKNKKSLFKLLYSAEEVQDLVRNKGKEYAVSYIETELGKMDLDYLADRAPVAMSNLQRLRASCLYDVLDSKYDFLLCDCETARIEDREKRINSKRPYFTIAEYMRCSDQYKFAMYDLVWITDLSVDEMIALLGDSAKEDDYSFFTQNGIDIIEINKEELLSEFAKKKEQPPEQKKRFSSSIYKPSDTAYKAVQMMISKRKETSSADAEKVFNEARNYDRYFRTALPQYRGKDDLKKAFELYKSAAESGHTGAQFQLAEMYHYGHEACAVNEEKALYWYIMAEFSKTYGGRISDDVLDEVHFLAPMRIKYLVLRVPNGKELLRKYAGNKAEVLIEEAQHEEQVQKLLDNAPPLDQEYFNKKMREALDWKL